MSVDMSQFQPPYTAQQLVEERMHGVTIRDNYRWLENADEPEVKKWTADQHAFTLAFVQKQFPILDGVREEISALIDRDIDHAPFFKADREFFFRRQRGAKQDILCTRINGEERVIFDPMSVDAEGRASISFFRLTPDASKAALGYQSRGSEINSVFIIDTQTGARLSDELHNIMSFNWARDERYGFITPRSAELVKSQSPLPVYLHRLGDDHSRDVVIMQPLDAKDHVYAFEPEEADVQMTGMIMNQGNLVRLRPLNSTEEPKQLYADSEFMAFPSFRDQRVYWYTNNNAPRFKLMLTTLDAPEFSNAKELIAQSDDVLSDLEISRDYIIAKRRRGVLSRLVLYSLEGEHIRDLELPEIAHVGTIRYHKESNRLYVSLDSFTTTSKLYAVNLDSLQWSLVWSDNPPVDFSDVEAHVSSYTSKDGTEVPVFIVHKKGIVLDGSNPTLLIGYGGFALGIKPKFIGSAASFLRRGGVWVNAGLRGGDEYGEQWHRDGMLEKKQNTFDDFISCAEFLIHRGYTSPKRLLIQGGSNGGLLVGAAITQRPELFAAAVCEVPLLDMLRYSKFKIARYWIPEYGDPEKAEEFATLLEYSPYHKVLPGLNLPLTLVTVGEYDSRTDPLHGKKFVAAAQNNSSQTHPVLLHVDYDAGHQGGTPIQTSIDASCFRWQFIMGALGMS